MTNTRRRSGEWRQKLRIESLILVTETILTHRWNVIARENLSETGLAQRSADVAGEVGGK